PWPPRQIGRDPRDRGEAGCQRLRAPLDELRRLASNADRLLQGAQRVLDDAAAPLAAQQQADGRLIVRVTQQVAGGGEVEVQLAYEGGFEGDCLQLDDHVAAQPQVVEEEVEDEVLIV